MRLLMHLITWILFFDSFLPFPSSSSSHLCLEDQRSALLQLKMSFSIDAAASGDPSGYPKVSNWKPNTDCCSWDGVTCDGDTGLVIGLDLSSSFLGGSIDNKSSLFHLHDLQELNLADNDFNYSQIPSAFGRLTSLTHLNLSLSAFSGQIPLQISQLTKLVSLDLSSNYDLRLKNPGLKALTQNLSNLRELRLDCVNMSAEVNRDWCKSLSLALPDLCLLSLASCSLPGPMDDSLLNFHFLTELSLGNNSFSSKVPDFLGNHTSLRSLDLLNCGLYGEFPRNILQRPNLQSLKISINPVSGKLPEFSRGSVLQYLEVSDTNLSCKLPNSIVNLKFLTLLRFSNCSLTGLIPPWLANLTQLVTLDLSYNNFHGAISSSLFFLPSLQYLDLSGNQFTTVKEDFHYANFSSFSLLQELDLRGNQLKGMIPKSIFHLTNLKTLMLAYNDFNDILDLNMLQNLKNLTILHLQHNRFSLSNNSAENFTSPQLVVLFARSCDFQKFPIFLKNQNNLEILDLSKNRIQGKIPKWIWKPSTSELNLSHNLISGLELPVPDLETQYISIELHSNKITEEFPGVDSNNETISNILGNLTSYLTNATIFNISSNKLTGKIPPSICNSSHIQILDLSNNQLSGQIPECPYTFGQSLNLLNLAGNKFRGTIPQSFLKGSKLNWININNNQLEGRIPRSLANCRSLKVLDLGNNKINDTFPFWLGNLPRLQVLILRFNKFYGSIEGPRTSYAFPMLHFIDLSFNNFTGKLPSEYIRCWKAMQTVQKDQLEDVEQWIKIGSRVATLYIWTEYYLVTAMNKGQKMEYKKILITLFTAIDFSNNKFQWEIPKEMGDLVLLKALNLSGNSLTGQIPSSLGHLIQLESLDLSRNQISGKIPPQLTNLTFLSTLKLAHNHLVGSIPRSTQFDTFESTSYEGNLGLCGFPLSRMCETTDSPSVLALMPQQKNGDSTSGLNWKFVLVGYGCGMIIGVIVGGQVPFWRINEFFRITPRRRSSNSKEVKRKARQHAREN